MLYVAAVPSNAKMAAPAEPCGASVDPFQSRSPPEETTVPESKLNRCPEVSVMVPVTSANDSSGQAIATSAIAAHFEILITSPSRSREI
jgi:hypothetical protein